MEIIRRCERRIEDFIKVHTTYASGRAIRDIVMESRLFWRHRLALRKARQAAQSLPLKLNLGCGPNCWAGWLNIDLFYTGADLQLDLRRRWPFPDSSVSYIYSEHIFEHLEFFQEVPHFLSESVRVLQDGGVFDVGVPDTGWPLGGYGRAEHDYWAFAATCHPASCETQLDHLNFHFRQGEQHRYAWDEATMRRTLERSGFARICRRGFDAKMDSANREVGTLYMRAVKERSIEGAKIETVTQVARAVGASH
jgi:predicted SAM-dependent methyltransferase